MPWQGVSLGNLCYRDFSRQGVRGRGLVNLIVSHEQAITPWTRSKRMPEKGMVGGGEKERGEKLC
jgi:hypothetical protein